MGELREARLDISGGSGTGACEDVTPVALGVDQQVFLAHLHEGVADTGITVGVELHRVTHDVRHLVEAAVVHPLHRVEDTSLHGFQTVAQVGHGTFEDHVGSVIQEPVLIHATEVVYGCRVEAVYGFIVGMTLFLVFRRLLFQNLFVLCFVVHSFWSLAFLGCNAAIKREKMQAGLQSSERKLLRALLGAKVVIFFEKNENCDSFSS